jgi:hypothetical protein
MGVNLKMKEGDFLVMRGESVHQEAGVFSAFFVCRMQCISGLRSLNSTLIEKGVDAFLCWLLPQKLLKEPAQIMRKFRVSLLEFL